MLIDIGLPISVVRGVNPKIEEIASGTTVHFTRMREAEYPPLPLSVAEIPDMISTHQLSIIMNRDRMAQSGNFENLQGQLPEIRDELKQQSFEDPSGLFSLVCLVPLLMIHHKDLPDPPSSWAELAEEKWKGKITVSSLRIVRRLLRFYMTQLLGDNAAKFFDNVDFEGAPIDTNLKVDSGKKEIGLVPLPFARASRNKNFVMRWPEEGAVCVPQVIIHKKGSFEQTRHISEYLLSAEVQRYMAESGMVIPVHSEAALPPELLENNLHLCWQGWDWFISGLNQASLSN
jgi:ABC-type Fe3+ transport system substrate-binding protein